MYLHCCNKNVFYSIIYNLYYTKLILYCKNILGKYLYKDEEWKIHFFYISIFLKTVLNIIHFSWGD